MADQAVSVLDGGNFVVSDRHGDVRPDVPLPPHGFFSEDTRFLSLWRLTVQGRPTDLLSYAQAEYFVSEFFLSSPGLGILRRRLLGNVWMEDVVVVNHRDQHAAVALDMEVATDFADLFEVKDGAVRGRRIVADRGDRELVLCYRNGGFVRETRITVSEDATIEENALRLDLRLAALEERRVSFVIEPGARRPPPRRSLDGERRERRAELDAWVAGAPRLETENEELRQVYRRSLADLAALRLYPDPASHEVSLPAAGLPWFMTLFGRDSLICAYQALPYRPELARTTLIALAARQGMVVDDFRDEEPGKILHEVRFGELTATGERPHTPYYGSADSTPLFLVLLDEYERWTGDVELVRELERAARLALDWIDRYGDLDGDGYIEYATRNRENGLVNQCWKDSPNSILFADGRIAGGPIAACEVQGYVYDAKRRGARLARRAWDDAALAERLEAEADALRARFLEDFWIDRRECFALALDGEKRRVDSLCSNMGHLLWSGIVDEERSRAIAAHLMDSPLHSGWGVRTMASTEDGYDPFSYHNGSVWPHDNSLIAAGLSRYGHNAEAARIAETMVRAAGWFEHRLPELFAGHDEQAGRGPVEYPTASSPQAWAAGAPLLLLTTVLGLAPGRGSYRVPPRSFGGISRPPR